MAHSTQFGKVAEIAARQEPRAPCPAIVSALRRECQPAAPSPAMPALAQLKLYLSLRAAISPQPLARYGSTAKSHAISSKIVSIARTNGN
jgi:hypothetical protein